jgi:DNA adenine methylase
VLSDANPELIELYQVVRDTPARLMDALDCLATRYSEEFYYQMRSSQPEDPVERAARAVFLNKTGFNGLYRQNSKGHFNVPFGKRVSCPALYVRRHLLALSERLQEVTLLCSDFESVIDRAGPGDFVYCDPPYEPLSASSSFNAYKAGGFGQLEQRRLRDACARAARRGANLLVSNSAAPLIRELYKDWVIHELLARRAINSNGSGRGEITELAVWIGPEQNDAHNQKLSVDLAVPRTGIVELNSVLV